MKKAVSIIMVLIMTLTLFTVPVLANDSETEMSDAKIIDLVVDNMKCLAKIPRPSHHEKAISDYLMDWAKEQGLDPSQDEFWNVMFEIPATEGMEDLPLIILQGHMDMVAVAEDDQEFDPLTDPITVIRDDENGTLTADGTSLGADDGIGVSIIMAVAQGKMAHGPLRAIFTSNEEDGMEGAANLDPEWLNDAPWLISIDNEDAGSVLVSTASGDSVRQKKELNSVGPSGDKTLRIEISNLKGGHSGIEIDKGRLNGIVALGEFLNQLEKEGIVYELSSFKGGFAGNAIPSQSEAVIVISTEDQEQIWKKLAAYCEELNEQYKGIENKIQCEVTEMDSLPKVVSNQEKEAVIRFITETFTGVYAMSDDMEGLVQSSANFAIFELDPEEATAIITVRSSDPDERIILLDEQEKLAQECGFETTIDSFANAWKYDPDSRLTELAKKIYREQNGEDICVLAVHAGLECGCFKEKNPDLDMISIGPDLKDGHTPNETVYLNSIPKTWHLLEGIITSS